jgi:2-oxoisovalerate dehydrogenase E2 component (dihydrolipoyl transacylase)
MDTKIGLLVPVIKNVESKSLFEIANEITRLSNLGQDGKLSQDDLSGGSFTLSNVGVIGGTYCSPLLVVPQVIFPYY